MNTIPTSFRALVASVACALAASAASAQVIADSQSNFSGTQGQGNWSYGYYSGAAPLGPSNFDAFPTFVGSGATGQWERSPSAYATPGAGYFTALTTVGGHPHALAGGIAQTNFAVRRWTSPIAGTIIISGSVKKTSDFFSGVQDGILARIIVGASDVFSVDIPATDVANRTFSVPACVSVGTTIDFAVDPKTNEFSDGFEFPVTIRTAAPTVIDGPLSNLSCPSGITAFGLDVIGGIGTSPLVFQWQILTAPGNWANLGPTLVDIPCPQGSGGTMGVASAGQSDTATLLLRVRPCTGGTVDNGAPSRYQIRCIITDGCQSTTSPEATFTVCPADFNCSSAVTVQDVFDFLSAWFNAEASANFNLTGGVTVQDVFDFLTAWFNGCE